MSAETALFWQVGIAVVTIGASGFVQVWIYRWIKRDRLPEKLREEINELRDTLAAVRGQVKYLEGKINGKHWVRD